MKNLQRIAGVCALLEAFIYIGVFVLYGTMLATPSNLSIAEKLAFLKEKQQILFLVNLIGYILFGLILAVLVLALHERFQVRSKTLSQLASIFGILWVGLVITSGMLSNIGLSTVLKLSTTEPEQTRALWLAVSTVAEALGGGNEVVGGLWVLLISVAGIRAQTLPRTLHFLGIGVGLAGIATCIPGRLLTDVFGVSQILWFSYLGLTLLTQASEPS
ncbi:MAG: DUF4386 family protein [Burkholderiaceae bacterium]|nr:MAG: DUF4386 family protein [Burkholderiaceae bacterium]